jgi:hypothetical protein
MYCLSSARWGCRRLAEMPGARPPPPPYRRRLDGEVKGPEDSVGLPHESGGVILSLFATGGDLRDAPSTGRPGSTGWDAGSLRHLPGQPRARRGWDTRGWARRFRARPMNSLPPARPLSGPQGLYPSYLTRRGQLVRYIPAFRGRLRRQPAQL